MKIGGQIPWNATPICETFKISCLMGKRPYERRFGKPYNGPIIPFGSLVEYYPISAKDQSIIHQFGKKVLPGLSLGYALCAGGIWKGDILVAYMKELETMDASEIYSKRFNAKEVIFPKENRKFVFSSRRWTNQTFWRRLGTENTHLDTGPPNARRRSKGFSWRIRRVSFANSWLISRCRWSDERFLVHVRKLHIPPSRWTQSQTFLAERRIIPYSTKIHWRLQNYSYKLGCYARTLHRRLLEHRWVKRFVWFLDRFHSVYLIGRKPPDGYMWSGWDWQESSYHPGQIIYGQNSGSKWEEVSSWRRSIDGPMKNRNSILPEDYEEFISLTLRTRNSKKPLRMLARNWKRRWLLLCLARQARHVSMVRPVAKPMRSNQNMRVSWKPVNPQDCVWKNLYL